MFNAQQITALQDFFSTFKVVLQLAANPAQIDTAISGLDDAKQTIETAKSSKESLDELAAFKLTRAQQLLDIKTLTEGAAAAVTANEARAQELTDLETALNTKDTAQKTKDTAQEEKDTALANRQVALENSEAQIKIDQQAAVDALAEANAVKKQYTDKLAALADVENVKAPA